MLSEDAGLHIRVKTELREAIQEACLAENQNMSEVLRELMQVFAVRYQGGLQQDMYTTPAARKPRQLTKKK
jgi:hypothetical protein